jgi:hypothetical protein
MLSALLRSYSQETWDHLKKSNLQYIYNFFISPPHFVSVQHALSNRNVDRCLYESNFFPEISKTWFFLFGNIHFFIILEDWVLIERLVNCSESLDCTWLTVVVICVNSVTELGRYTRSQRFRKYEYCTVFRFIKIWTYSAPYWHSAWPKYECVSNIAIMHKKRILK